MRILADIDIPFAHEVFSRFGEVRLVKGRGLTRADLAGVDALIVRSVTRVDRALLADTAVRFVGTATIGVDHVDLDLLRATGVGFASAAGCNATAVAEYVIAALAGTGQLGAPVGVIGFGNVGRALTTRLRALGVDVAVNDPLLEGQTDEPLVPLAALAGRPVLTAHVPHTHAGPHRTIGLVDARVLAAIPAGGLVINTARGGVVDEAALKAAWAAGRDLDAVLDVWAKEPSPDPALVAHPRVRYATPHVAGHSLDGKIHGTRLVYEAMCAWLGVLPAFPFSDHLPASGALPTPVGEPAAVLPGLVGLDADTVALRAAVRRPDPARAFDALRAARRQRWAWAYHDAPAWRAFGFGESTGR